jgi:hypothetical protein
MTNIADNISNLSFNAEFDKVEGFDVEYKEHFDDVLYLVKNVDLANKIINAIAMAHLRENENYYSYLKKMEKEMNT